ncbi:hypothetical protein NQZ68_034024 [Dissostichus eleginoides]|nr:hypothetical protein NQZ68_034024 [Dissostichus eleginoides]
MRIAALPLSKKSLSNASVESSESGQMSTGSTGRNKEEYAMLADVPKVKMIHQREGPSHMVRPQTPQPSRRQELFKPASHSLSKHPSREWEETGESERDWHYGGSGYLSRAHSYTSLQRSGSPSADEGSSRKSNHNRSEQMQLWLQLSREILNLMKLGIPPDPVQPPNTAFIARSGKY